MSSSGVGRDIRRLFDDVRPALPLPTAVSPILQGDLKDGFGEPVMLLDMHEACEFPPLNSCQKRLLWANNTVDLAPHPVVGLVLHKDTRLYFVMSSLCKV